MCVSIVSLPLRWRQRINSIQKLSRSFRFFVIFLFYICCIDLLHCGNANILLTDSSPVHLVQAPLGVDDSQCKTSLSCAWFIISDPGTSIYIKIHGQRGSHESYSYSLYDEVVIGRGHDPFNKSSVVVEVELFYKRRLDDGRVYMVDSNLAWIRIFAHSEGFPDCVWFEMSFTQRGEPG